MINGVSLLTLSNSSAGTKFSPDCAFKTGVEGNQPERPAIEDTDKIALLIDANRFWVAVLMIMFTVGATATTTVVTNASAMLTTSPISVKAAI